MRPTLVFVLFAAAGCFSPIVADGGFACDPAAVQPCPSGYYCRNRANQYVCTRSPTATPPVVGGDMGTGSGGNGGGGGTGGGDMAGSGDMAQAANCGVADLLINEVATRGSTAADEWVEVYNPCAQDITFTGSIVYRAAAATNDSSIVANLTSRVFPMKGYFLVANTGYAGSADVKPFVGGGMADDGGGVALRDGNMKIISSMAWGSGTDNKFQQGSPAAAITGSSSLARTPNGKNTKNDSSDFALASSPTPRAAN